MNNNDLLAGQQHNDVLTAQLETKEDKERLVEELKRRGNAAFQVKSLREAEILYSKAIEHSPEIAALWGNRSMTRLLMSQAEDAVLDAQEAIKRDPTWSKGYFRLGQAYARLKKHDEAIQNFEKVLELEPKSKAAVEEIEKSKNAKAEKKAEDAKLVGTNGLPKSSVVKKVVKTGVDRMESKKSTTEEAEGVDDEKLDINMRGYRTLADGRKTTFFNREQSAEDKELLAKTGKLQPVKLETDAEAEFRRKQGVGSAWNPGNTFEEKDLNKWATDKLKELLIGLKERCKEVVTLEVVNISEVDGDASIAVTRGQKRHIFDFNFSVEWEAKIIGKEELNIKGTLFYPDFNGDDAASGTKFESEIRWPSSNREQAKDVESVILSGLKSVQVQIQKALELWVKEFHNLK